MKTALLLSVAMLTAASAAHATEPGALDLYYLPYSGFDVDVPNTGVSSDFNDSGTGVGAKAFVPLGDMSQNTLMKNIVLTGAYQNVELDDTETDLHELRAGAGYQADLGGMTAGAFAEYVKISPENDDAEGVGAHARLFMPIGQRFKVYGEAGYLWLGGGSLDIDGPEFLVGASYDINPMAGGFIDYRYIQLEDDNNVDYTLDDIRVGVRFRFGAYQF